MVMRILSPIPAVYFSNCGRYHSICFM